MLLTFISVSSDSVLISPSSMPYVSMASTNPDEPSIQNGQNITKVSI